MKPLLRQNLWNNIIHVDCSRSNEEGVEALRPLFPLRKDQVIDDCRLLVMFESGRHLRFMQS
jgi:hypothetical protein